jgi:hypothetical protein
MYSGWASVQNFTSVNSVQRWFNIEYFQQKEKVYDELVINDYVFTSSGRYIGRRSYIVAAPQVFEKEKALQVPIYDSLGISLESKLEGRIAGVQIANPQDEKNEAVVVSPIVQNQATIDQSQIQIRKNFNETVFFFPELRTDKDGNIEFSFTMPEALTQWKLMALAHTKDLAFGYSEKSVVTQKQLMVQPNVVRFVREGDNMEFSAKIVNLDTTAFNGQIQLQLFNASTMNPVDGLFKNTLQSKNFTVGADQSVAIKFNIEIPEDFNDALVYRIVAKAGGNSDGEEAAIPVLSNRMLITETMPLPMRGNEVKNFIFEKLLHSSPKGGREGATLTNHALTVEFTTNPAWYAVQALPYLMEYPYDCAEQIFNRYYANSIATKIVNSSPKIKAVFDKWAANNSTSEEGGSLLSNLQKSQELKSVLLEETPWVLEAKSEEQQKKNIALLFDMVRMSGELESSLSKLKDMQSPNGGFVWFKGGPDDRYITQYILTGIGHLKKLNAITKDQDQKLLSIVNTAIPYLDRKLKEDYDNLKKYKSDQKVNNTGTIAIQFLYMRSFFPEHGIAKQSQAAYNYYIGQAKKFWLSQGKFMQAMTALFLYRSGDRITPRAIMRSLKENSINNEELGMYWKEWNIRGYWWYQAPIESQAMMIEAFREISNDQTVINDLKIWLLKNKQTNNWNTSKATADACYALLLQGNEPTPIGWLSEQKNVVIKLGSTTIDSKEQKQEEGTGYFKHKIDGDNVTPQMGNILVTVSSGKEDLKVPPLGGGGGWGAVYWQYFENLDKITFAETPLKLSKKLFIEKNTDRGPVLTPISGGDSSAKVGDKIKVRIELRVDRDMEYIHMKDMRAACMEPTNVISKYKWQDGLGYYETTKDASTNFFFNYLPRGTYVFEYPVVATNAGNFSNGITTIQCMYAPEFTAHSEGVRVNIER